MFTSRLKRLRALCADAVDEGSSGAASAGRLDQLISRVRALDSAELLSAMSGDPWASGFLSSFLLMGASGSLQGPAVDLEHPRIISFHGSSAIALTGSEDPPNSRFNQEVERFQYDYGTESWVPGVIRLSKTDGATRGDATSCSACHGTPVRPLWRSYRIWPGAYVTNRDYFVTEEGKRAAFRRKSPL